MDKHSSEKRRGDTPEPILVSIIVVSWNARDFLVQCLASLSALVCRYPMEIIVVDNCSTDGSGDAVDNLYPNVTLIRNNDNLGFSKANNIGINACSGKYIGFINSDVEVLPGCVTGLVDFLEDHRDVGMVGPRIRGGDGELQRSCRGFPSIWNMLCCALALDTTFPRVKLFSGYALYHWSQETQRDVDILSGCFWLIRRDALDNVGLLDEAFFIYGEDMDWCKRFWENGWRLVFVPNFEAIHYGGVSSANSPVRFYIEKQKADLKYWKKHHSIPGYLAYACIAFLHNFLRALGFSVALSISPRKQEWRHKVRRSVACLKWMLTPARRLV